MDHTPVRRNQLELRNQFLRERRAVVGGWPGLPSYEIKLWCPILPRSFFCGRVEGEKAGGAGARLSTLNSTRDPLPFSLTACFKSDNLL